jgi:hypothetical protein
MGATIDRSGNSLKIMSLLYVLCLHIYACVFSSLLPS